jgi:hypothetical protein
VTYKNHNGSAALHHYNTGGLLAHVHPHQAETKSLAPMKKNAESSAACHQALATHQVHMP